MNISDITKALALDDDKFLKENSRTIAQMLLKLVTRLNQLAEVETEEAELIRRVPGKPSEIASGIRFNFARSVREIGSDLFH